MFSQCKFCGDNLLRLLGGSRNMFLPEDRYLIEAAQDAAPLSHMRYTGGVTGYVEVLTNETNAFSTELGLVLARQNELLALSSCTKRWKEVGSSEVIKPSKTVNEVIA